MFNKFQIYAFSLCALSLPLFTSCSDDDNNDPKGLVKVGEITFENTDITLAGPDSSGANLYDGFTGEQKFTSGSIAFNNGAEAIQFGLNTHGDWFEGTATLYNGGMFISQFNHRSNPEGKTGDWWYSYNNQCSVYNTGSTDGSNQGAGYNNSNTFAVINGSCFLTDMSTTYGNGKEVSLAGFSFDNASEFVVGNIKICNTAYAYGVIKNGNAFASALEAADGWFKVLAYGYDANGKMTAGSPVEYYLCNYSASGTQKSIAETWETWNLSQLGNVNRVVFNFDGSDSSEYGMNTPAYAAIDNIEIYVNQN